MPTTPLPLMTVALALALLVNVASSLLIPQQCQSTFSYADALQSSPRGGFRANSDHNTCTCSRSGMSINTRSGSNTHTQLRSALAAPMWATPSGEEQDVRNLLDEAVMMFQKSMEQGAATDEAESVVCEVGRILHNSNAAAAAAAAAATLAQSQSSTLSQSLNNGNTREAISQQLDQAVMAATKDPSTMPQVEELAAEYHRLLLHGDTDTKGTTRSTTTNISITNDRSMTKKSSVFDQVVLSESQLRLQKLRQSLDDGTTSTSKITVSDTSHSPVEITEPLVDIAPEAQEEKIHSAASAFVAETQISFENMKRTVPEPPVDRTEPTAFVASEKTIAASANIPEKQDSSINSKSATGDEKVVSSSLNVKDEESFPSQPAPSASLQKSDTVSATSSVLQDLNTTPPDDDQKVASSPPLIAKDESLLKSSIDPAAVDEKINEPKAEVDEVDIAIVGAGIGGLCAGAILNTLYGKKVGIYESHYLAGGCAHAFDRVAPNGMTFTFDSGPTIVLGCSKAPYNPLRQVLDAIGESVEWLEYKGWGMIENPGKENELRWKVELGEGIFQEGPIKQFGSDNALDEFEGLRKATAGLVSGAVQIPAMAMRAGKSALIPLLRYLPALVDIIKQGEELTTGTFAPYMDGPLFVVSDPWLRSWLDALAFSLSGLPASRTSAAAMAYVLFDMHRPNAALDYPRGGLGSVINALVSGVEQGDNGSKVQLRSHVESIDSTPDGGRITGLTLRSGKKVMARDGVISNVPVWSLTNLIKNRKVREVLNNSSKQGETRQPRKSWVNQNGVNFIPQKREPVDDTEESLLSKCDKSEMTGSFLHLHLALKADGLDLTKMEAHYTVMDRSLAGDGSSKDGPCGELNMIAVSNPCVIDDTLAPEGFIVVHAYGAGNEPYEVWKDLKRGSAKYNELKDKRSEVLWRAVESIIPDVRERVVLDMVGSPITHERFLRRPMGTYGSATEDYLKDGSTPYESLVLAGDSIFPGIGVPAVALSGASAANAMVSPFKQWNVLDKLKRRKLI